MESGDLSDPPELLSGWQSVEWESRELIDFRLHGNDNLDIFVGISM